MGVCVDDTHRMRERGGGDKAKGKRGRRGGGQGEAVPIGRGREAGCAVGSREESRAVWPSGVSEVQHGQDSQYMSGLAVASRSVKLCHSAGVHDATLAA